MQQSDGILRPLTAKIEKAGAGNEAGISIHPEGVLGQSLWSTGWWELPVWVYLMTQQPRSLVRVCELKPHVGRYGDTLGASVGRRPSVSVAQGTAKCEMPMNYYGW